jgi:hypothetical protein
MDEASAIAAFSHLYQEEAGAREAAEQALRQTFWFFLACLFVDLKTPNGRNRYAAWAMDQAREGAAAYVRGQRGNAYTDYLRRTYGTYA